MNTYRNLKSLESSELSINSKNYKLNINLMRCNMLKIKLLSIVALAVMSTTTFAQKETRSTALSKAESLVAKGNIADACKAYQKAYDLGPTDEAAKTKNPNVAKEYIAATLGLAACMQRADPFDYSPALMYNQLKHSFESEEADQQLKQMQLISLKEASLLKSHKLEDFKKPTEATNQACRHAEFGYNLGFMGNDSEMKNAEINKGFVINGIYHSTCMSLNPNFFFNGDAYASRLLAMTILEQLAREYGSSIAAEIVASN